MPSDTWQCCQLGQGIKPQTFRLILCFWGSSVQHTSGKLPGFWVSLADSLTSWFSFGIVSLVQSSWQITKTSVCLFYCCCALGGSVDSSRLWWHWEQNETHRLWVELHESSISEIVFNHRFGHHIKVHHILEYCPLQLTETNTLYVQAYLDNKTVRDSTCWFECLLKSTQKYFSHLTPWRSAETVNFSFSHIFKLFIDTLGETVVGPSGLQATILPMIQLMQTSSGFLADHSSSF